MSDKNIKKNIYEIISDKNILKEIKKTNIYSNLKGANNKKAFNIWVDKGPEEALKYMLTCPVTGKNLIFS